MEIGDAEEVVVCNVSSALFRRCEAWFNNEKTKKIGEILAEEYYLVYSSVNEKELPLRLKSRCLSF